MFFAKGVTLLYTKENLIILKKLLINQIVNHLIFSKNKNNIRVLNTKKVYYPKIKIFNLLEKVKKNNFKNIKVNKEKFILK